MFCSEIEPKILKMNNYGTNINFCPSKINAPVTPRIIRIESAKNTQKSRKIWKNCFPISEKICKIQGKFLAKNAQCAEKNSLSPRRDNSLTLSDLQDLLITFSQKQPIFENFGMIFERERERER
jgi:hypothetical protein